MKVIRTLYLAGAESNGQVLTYESGNWTNMNPTGEANTCSNIGTAGVGVYIDKVGVDFELKNINVGDKLTVTDDTVLNTIDIGVDPSATFPPSAHTLESHSVMFNVSNPQLNDFLGFNGTYWVNAQIPDPTTMMKPMVKCSIISQPTWGTPANGEVMVNNTSYGSVTELMNFNTDDNGNDCTQRLTRLAIGDTIAVFLYDNWGFVAITGIANDNTYFDFGVSVITSNGSPPTISNRSQWLELSRYVEIIASLDLIPNVNPTGKVDKSEVIWSNSSNEYVLKSKNEISNSFILSDDDTATNDYQ